VVKYVQRNYPNGTTYADFAKDFTAKDFDADRFAEIIKSSGARYFVLTSKHHEGFTLWPSNTAWQWNAKDVGPKRDLVGELRQAILKQQLHFGLYFSLFDWFHPLYLSDSRLDRTDYPTTVSYPQLLEIVNTYHPEVIWSDGDWERSELYWRSRDFIAWLYNESPVKDVVAINDRWGRNMVGKHGGFMTYGDRYNPGHLLPRKWENCMTMDRQSWGYRRDMRAEDVLTLKEIVTELATTISCGGNLLLNVGPDRYGRIVPIFEERLRLLGRYVQTNQEAIFGTKPWIHQNDTNSVWYTSRVRSDAGLEPGRIFNPQSSDNTIVYAFILDIPTTPVVHMNSVKTTDKTKVTLLGAEQEAIRVTSAGAPLSVDLSQVPWRKWPSIELLVLKIEYAGDSNFDPLLSIRNREKMAAMQQQEEGGENLVEAILKTTLASDQED
jgi:alpha-L-fucosidase